MSGEASLRRNTAWTVSGQIAATVLQAAYFVLISRTLGSYDYGLFVGIYSLVAVLGPFSTLGFGMIMVRDASRDATKLSQAWGRSLGVLYGGSLMIIALAVTLGHFLFHGQLLVATLCIAFADSFCARAVELAGQAFQSRHQLAWTAKLSVLPGITRVAAASCLLCYSASVHIHASLLLWTGLYTSFAAVGAAIALLVVRFRLVRARWPSLSAADASEGISFAVSSSSFSVYNDIDKTLLTSYGFIQAAGTYAAAYRLIEVATAPVRALYSAALPRIFQYGAEGRTKVVRFSLTLLQVSSAYAVLAFAVLWFTAPLAPVVLGKSFAGSVAAIRILALLPLLRCFHYSAGNAISGCASQWYRTSAQLFAAGLNLVLNLLLLPHWSWKGAAVASLVTDGTLGLLNWGTLLLLKVQASRQRKALHATSDLAFVCK